MFGIYSSIPSPNPKIYKNPEQFNRVCDNLKRIGEPNAENIVFEIDGDGYTPVTKSKLKSSGTKCLDASQFELLFKFFNLNEANLAGHSLVLERYKQLVRESTVATKKDLKKLFSQLIEVTLNLTCKQSKEFQSAVEYQQKELESQIAALALQHKEASEILQTTLLTSDEIFREKLKSEVFHENMRHMEEVLKAQQIFWDGPEAELNAKIQGLADKIKEVKKRISESKDTLIVCSSKTVFLGYLKFIPTTYQKRLQLTEQEQKLYPKVKHKIDLGNFSQVHLEAYFKIVIGETPPSSNSREVFFLISLYAIALAFENTLIQNPLYKKIKGELTVPLALKLLSASTQSLLLKDLKNPCVKLCLDKIAENLVLIDKDPNLQSLFKDLTEPVFHELLLYNFKTDESTVIELSLFYAMQQSNQLSINYLKINKDENGRSFADKLRYDLLTEVDYHRLVFSLTKQPYVSNGTHSLILNRYTDSLASNLYIATASGETYEGFDFSECKCFLLNISPKDLVQRNFITQTHAFTMAHTNSTGKAIHYPVTAAMDFEKGPLSDQDELKLRIQVNGKPQKVQINLQIDVPGLSLKTPSASKTAYNIMTPCSHSALLAHLENLIKQSHQGSALVDESPDHYLPISIKINISIKI